MSDKSVCEWPGCDKEALCQSGNFDNKLVCSDHFDLTNGSSVIDLVKQDDDWDDLEDSLSQFKSQKLLIDGYNVSLRLEHISKMELGIAVYVNGSIKMKWTSDESDSPIPGKFWWKRKRSLYSKKQWKSLGKIYSKKELEENFTKAINYYAPYFKSYCTLKRTFMRNNDNIKWLKTDGN